MMDLKNKLSEIGSGASSLANKVGERTLVSIASVLLESGMSEERMSKILEKIGCSKGTILGIMANVHVENTYEELRIKPEAGRKLPIEQVMK